jgi:hypothetical protein
VGHDGCKLTIIFATSVVDGTFGHGQGPNMGRSGVHAYRRVGFGKFCSGPECITIVHFAER